MSATAKSRRDEARDAATDLLQKMETVDLPVERHLLQAKRVARLLRDADAETWLGLEISGYQAAFDPGSLGDCLRYAETGGRVTPDGKYYLISLPCLEATCATDRQRVEAAVPKPVKGTAENYVVAGATKQMYVDQVAALAVVKATYLQNVALLASLRAAVHSYVTDALIAVEFGDVAESFFDDLRKDVDAFIRSHSPKAAEQLLAITERMAEGNTEAYAEALTSCRRLLMTVADSVFPASDKDRVDSAGNTHKVGRDNYKNRLAAFIETRLASGSSGSILENELEHLCSRLDAVYEKACKGVHTDVSAEEARLAIIQGYILIGEVARMQKSTGHQAPADGGPKAAPVQEP